jgi:hypothetical protein
MKNIKIKYNRVVKYINSLINKILLKQKNKKDNNFSFKFKLKVSSFNKYIIVIISVLFLYLFYLLIPTLYDKNWVQSVLEKKLMNEFNINLSLSSDISYEILPSPHFTIKNGKIIDQNESMLSEIAEIEELKVFISNKRFFNKDKLKINSISIHKANFFIKKNYKNTYKKVIFNNIFNKKISIKKSNFFVRNKKNEIISIIKIPDGEIINDKSNIYSLLNFKGEVFNLPFVLTMNNNLTTDLIDEINIKFGEIDLNLNNKLSINTKNIIDGINIIQILNSKFVSNYQYKNDLIQFNSLESQTNKKGINYEGEILLKPFNFGIDIVLEKVDLSKLADPNSIILEMIKSGILFNENLSGKITLESKKIKANKFFDEVKVILTITNGQIDLNQTLLVNKDIGSLTVKNSRFQFLDNKLILSSNTNMNIKNFDRFYSFLQTPKKYRKKIESINFNIDYDFVENSITVNSFGVDNLDSLNNSTNIISDFNNQKNKNFIILRSFINRLFEVYFG